MAEEFWKNDKPADADSAANFWANDKPAGDQKTALGDLGRKFKSGIEQLPGMVTGLADIAPAIATGTRPFTATADYLGSVTGFTPGKWSKEIKYSDSNAAEAKNVDEAWAGVDAAQKDPTKTKSDVVRQALTDAPKIADAYIRNPMYTAGQIAESVPSMLAGGAASKGFMVAGRAAGVAAGAADAATGAAATTARSVVPGYLERTVGEKLASPIAAGAGEGAVTAGQQMDQYEGSDQQRNALASLAAGVGTGVIGIGAGRVAQKMGLETSGTAMAQIGDSATTAAEISAKRRILGGMISEAVLQELPQSAQEQVWQNYANGKPLMDGVLRSGVEGALAGAAMGAGANIRGEHSSPHQAGQDNQGPEAQVAQDQQPLAPTPTMPVDRAQEVGSGTTPETSSDVQPAEKNQLKPDDQAAQAPSITPVGTEAQAIKSPATEYQAPDAEAVKRENRLAVVGVADLAPNSPLTNAAITAVDSGMHQRALATPASTPNTQQSDQPLLSRAAGSTQSAAGLQQRLDTLQSEITSGIDAQTGAKLDGIQVGIRKAQANQLAAPTQKTTQQEPAYVPQLQNSGQETSPAQGTQTAQQDVTPIAPEQELTRAPEIATGPARVLQNRDRSSVASIAQMNEIAAKPDYWRAGQSRVMDSGAPVVFGSAPGGAIVGKADQIADGLGKRVPVQYAVVESVDVLPSHQADGAPIAEYQNGMPGKLRAVAGNGRAAGISEAYRRNTAAQYRQDLIDDAADLGVDPVAVRSMKAPVLVRVMPEDQVTDDIGDRSNIGGTAALSATEQAANDARRIDLSGLTFDDNGIPDHQSAAKFVNTMPMSERGTMMQPDGSPTRQLIDRITSAAFKAAYGNDDVVRLQAQSTDPEIRNIITAMASAAGPMAGLEGAGDFDVRGAVAEAAQMAVNAKRQGITLTDYLNNADITFSGEAFTVARFMAENIRSAKRMADGLRAWANYAAEQVAIVRENEYQNTMFGATPTASRGDTFNQLGATNEQTTQIKNGNDGSSRVADRAPRQEAQPAPEQNRPADSQEKPATQADRAVAPEQQGQPPAAQERGTEEVASAPAVAEQGEAAPETPIKARENPPFNPSSNAPASPGVYKMRDGSFARFDRNIWWRAMPSAKNALLTEFAGSDQMKPENRHGEYFDWIPYAEISKRDDFGEPSAMRLVKAEFAPSTPAAPTPPAIPNPNSVIAKARTAKAKKNLTLRESTAQANAERETITPANDKAIGTNNEGQALYQRADESIYRMNFGRPYFGDDLVPATTESVQDEQPAATQPAEPTPDEKAAEQIRTAELTYNTTRRLAAAYQGEPYKGVSEDYKTLRADLEARTADQNFKGRELAQGVLERFDDSIANKARKDAQKVTPKSVSEKAQAANEKKIKATELREFNKEWSKTKLGKFDTWEEMDKFRTARQESRANALAALEKGTEELKADFAKFKEQREAAKMQAAAPDTLTAPTPQDILDQQTRAEAAAQAEKSQQRAADERARHERERKDIAKASESAANTFVLGGDAEQNLSGQQSVFDAPAEQAAPAKKRPYQTFKEWFDDADMPEKMPDGTWVDLETGIKYQGEPDKKIEKTWAERQAIKRTNNLQRAMREIDAEKRNGIKALSLKEVSDKVEKLVKSQRMALERIGLNKESAPLVELINGIAEFGSEIQLDIDRAGNVSLLTKKSKDIKEKFLQLVELNSEASREQNRAIKAIQANRLPESVTSKIESPNPRPVTPAPITPKSPNNEAARATAYKYAPASSIETAAQGVLANATDRKERAFQRLKTLRAQVKDGRSDLRLELIRAETAHKDEIHAVDSAKEQIEKDANKLGLTTKRPVKFSRATTQIKGMTAAQVQAIADKISAGWSNAPKIIVATSMVDPRIPQAARNEDQRQRAMGATGSPEGFVHAGKVYLLADQLTSPERAAQVLLHESLGHIGLQGVFGSGLKTILQQIATMRRADVTRKAEQYGLGMSNAADRLTAAEEVLAEMAQTQPEIGFVKRAVAAIRTWLRDNVPGFKTLALTDAEIVRSYLLPARGFIERGAAADVGGRAAFSRGTNQSLRDIDGWEDMPAFQDDDESAILFNGGDGPYIKVVEDRLTGLWPGLFASKDIDKAHGPGMGENITAFRISNDKMLEDFDSLDEDEVRAKLLRLLPKRIASAIQDDEDAFDAVWKSVVEDRHVRVADEFNELFGLDYAEGSWEAQSLRGRLAAALGYDAVAMDDEHGTSWYIRPGIESIPLPTQATNPDIRFSRSKIVGQTTRVYSADVLAAMQNTGMQVEVPTLQERAKALWKDAGKKLTQGIVDQFSPVKDLSQDAYRLLRMSKGASGAFEAMMHGGMLKINDGVYDIDRTQRGGVIEKLFKPMQGEHHDFLRWVAANRAERLLGDGREHLFTQSDVDALKTLADGALKHAYTIKNGARTGQTTTSRSEMYKDSLVTFNEFNRNALDMAEQSGLIDAESRKDWESEFYVPFYRAMQEDGSGVVGGNIKGGVVRQSAFKHLKGGRDKLNADLLDNTLMNWAHLLDAGAKNRAALATLEAAQNMGVAIEANAEIARDIGKATHNRNGVVWAMDKGVQRYFVVDDPYIMTALTSLEYAGMRNPVMNAMGTMKRVLTVGVTASPFFKIRNLIRDSVQAIGLGDMSYNVGKNLKEGWKLTDPKSDAYFSLLASGGTIHFSSMYEGNESRRIQALVESGVDRDTILNDPYHIKNFYHKTIEPLVTAYNEVGNRGEAINRAALYDHLIKKGVSHAEAALQARDLMDFSMQGSFTSIRFLTQVVPFMNARLQGLYKLGKSAKENPQRFAAVLGVVTAVSLFLLAAYGDDDDWKRRDESDRNNFWWFKIGGIAYRIPKPFEIGSIATLAERGFELAFDKEMTNARFRSQVLKLLGDNLSMNPIPQLVKPMLDVYANIDGFSGRPIESMGMENLRPEYRFNEGTSMLARGASTALNSAANMLDKSSLSPVQIDHMLRGYFGWLGSFVIGTSELIARPVTGQPSKATPDYWKMATGSIASSLDGAQSRYVSSMYEQANSIAQDYATWRAMIKEGKPLEAQEYRAENAESIGKYHRIEAAKKQTATLNQQIKIIERGNASSAEKRERITTLRNQQNLIAKMAMSTE